MSEKTRRFDLMSWLFVAAALLCGAVSVPATYLMAQLTHDPSLAPAIVAVFEMTAFGAKLGSRWVPSWEKTLDRLTLVLLGVTTLGNFAAGWDWLWRHELVGFWASLRGASTFGVPVGAIGIVLVLSASAPVGMYVFLSLFIRRQRELETIRSPEAAAQQQLAPALAQLQMLSEFNKQLAALATAFSMVAEAPRPQLEGPPSEEPTQNQPDWSCAKCGTQMTISQWGVAKKHQKANGLPAPLCTNCR